MRQGLFLRSYHLKLKSKHFIFTFPGGIPTFGSFGIGTGPIFLNNIRCFGDEDNLLQCPSSGIKFITDCDHSRDVGVVCSSKWPNTTITIDMIDHIMYLVALSVLTVRVWPREVEPWFHSWYRVRVETLDAKYNLVSLF